MWVGGPLDVILDIPLWICKEMWILCGKLAVHWRDYAKNGFWRPCRFLSAVTQSRFPFVSSLLEGTSLHSSDVLWIERTDRYQPFVGVLSTLFSITRAVAIHYSVRKQQGMIRLHLRTFEQQIEYQVLDWSMITLEPDSEPWLTHFCTDWLCQRESRWRTIFEDLALLYGTKHVLARHATVWANCFSLYPGYRIRWSSSRGKFFRLLSQVSESFVYKINEYIELLFHN